MDIFSRLLNLGRHHPAIIRKGKKYVKAGQKPPKGVTLRRGKRGGTYYLVEDKHLKNEGKEHELIRSVGVTRDQWDDITRKHLAEGAESVHFVNKPENEKDKDGNPLYNIYIRLKDTDARLAELKEKNKLKRQKKGPVKSKDHLFFSNDGKLEYFNGPNDNIYSVDVQNPIEEGTGNRTGARWNGSKPIRDKMMREHGVMVPEPVLSYPAGSETTVHPHFTEIHIPPPPEENPMVELADGNPTPGIEETAKTEDLLISELKENATDDQIRNASDDNLQRSMVAIKNDFYRGLSPMYKDNIRRFEGGKYDRAEAEAVVRTHRDYHIKQKADTGLYEELEQIRMNQVYGKLSPEEIEKKIAKMDTEIDQHRKVASRKYNGNDSIPTGSAVSGRAVAEIGQEKMKLQRYLKEKFPDFVSEPTPNPLVELADGPIPEPQEDIPAEQPAKEPTKIQLFTSNKVGRARNLATERGVPMQRIHELMSQAEEELTKEYNEKWNGKEPEGSKSWVLQAMYAEKAEKRAVELITAEQPPAVEEGSVKAFILSDGTGKTYPIKSDIKYQFQGKWSKDNQGWMIHGKHADKVKEFAEKHGLTLEETEAEGDTFRMRTPDERRAIRAEKNQKKAAAAQERGERLIKQAEATMYNATGAKSFEKVHRALEVQKEGEHQLRRAKLLSQTPRMAGDTAKAREKVYEHLKEKATAEFIPGKTQVYHGWGRDKVGVVVKVNNKSAVIYDPETKRAHSWNLIGVRKIDDEGSLPSKKELQKHHHATAKKITKQEWDRTHSDYKMMDPYSRVRFMMEGSMAQGRGLVPVIVE